MTRFTTLLVTSVSTTLLIGAGYKAQAAQIVLAPATYSVMATGDAGAPSPMDSSEAPGNASASNSGAFGSAEGFARATPSQFVSGSGSVTEGAGGQFLGFTGEGQAALSYAFEIVNPLVQVQPVVMFIRASGIASFTGQGSANGFFQIVQTSAGSQGAALSVLDLSICAGGGCPDSARSSFTFGQKMSLLTNTGYVINLTANGGAANSDAAPFSGSGQAVIDPFFALDASVPDPGDFTLLFSPGIINAPPDAAVPEPASWTLFGAAGLMLLHMMIFGRRQAPRGLDLRRIEHGKHLMTAGLDQGSSRVSQNG